MKKILSILIAIFIALSTLSLLACGGDNAGSKVSSLTESILSKYSASGYISIEVDAESVRDKSIPREEDKSYIFESVYYPYLTLSSSLFFNVYKRHGFGDSAFKKFSKEQNESLFSKLNDANIALANLEYSIDIYENSRGTLHYIDVVNNYNIVIDKMYNLNYYFADIYFASENFKLQNILDLSHAGSLLNDYLWYVSCYMSRVSFGYEVVNFAYSNPFGDITSWLDKSIYTTATISLSMPVIDRLQNTIDISLVLPSTVKSSLHTILKNIDSQNETFFKNYSTFVYAKGLVDVQTYLNLQTISEKEEYLNRCSNLDRSRFSVVFNFLNNDYTALMTAMDYVSTYINS